MVSREGSGSKEQSRKVERKVGARLQHDCTPFSIDTVRPIVCGSSTQMQA